MSVTFIENLISDSTTSRDHQPANIFSLLFPFVMYKIESLTVDVNCCCFFLLIIPHLLRMFVWTDGE